MYIPNIISLLRIIMVPVIVWFILTGHMQFAFFSFALAGVSDAVDGFLAKRFKWQTELGAYLDPIADKALLVSIYVALGIFGHLPASLVLLVVSRDIIIIGAILLAWMLNRPIAMKPLPVSKANTLGQIILAALVLADVGFSLGLAALQNIMIWIVGILTVLSAFAYLMTWLQHMARYDAPKAK